MYKLSDFSRILNLMSENMLGSARVGFDVFVVSGGYEENIFDINSHGLAVATPPRGNGGSGSASDPTFPLST